MSKRSQPSPITAPVAHWDSINENVRQIRGLVRLLDTASSAPAEFMQKEEFAEGCSVVAELLATRLHAIENSVQSLYEDWTARTR